MTSNNQAHSPCPVFDFRWRGAAPPAIGRLIVLALALLPVATAVSAESGNRYPIVLVHGFTGWGPGDMGGYNYWGGTDDIPELLRAAGHPTEVGVVGPLSSNWDRACELYAYIKGGQVDYGAAHAAIHGHQRMGRTFPGLLPQWGLPGPHQRVHLVGHSQGGQTARVLAGLLARGDAMERQLAGDSGDLHTLFGGGQQHLVHSVTTLATPHDGNTLANLLQGDTSYLLNWLLALASYIGRHHEASFSYDFKLDQWNIARRDGESEQAYRERLSRHSIWSQTDISVYDLRPAGAMRLNRTFTAVDSVYYFSWATNDTVPGPLGRGYVPAIGMNLALISTSLAISGYVNLNPGPGLPKFDELWWPNDGVVNTVSMAGPRLGSSDRILHMDPDPSRTGIKPGIWHFMGTLDGWDHLDIVGQQTRLDYRSFYLQLAEMLAALPSN